MMRFVSSPVTTTFDDRVGTSASRAAGHYYQAMSVNGDVHPIDSIDRLTAYAVEVVPDRPELTDALRQYYLHVDPSDLAAKPVEDLFGMATQHLELAEQRTGGEVAISVTDPRVELDGWGSNHTLIQVLTEDMPFLVDTVTMELSRLGLGIHFVVHPVMYLDADGRPTVAVDPAEQQATQPGEPSGSRPVSMISIEVDPLSNGEQRAEIEVNLRRVLGDVKASVRDWRAMRDRMVEVAESLRTLSLPVADEERTETADLLDWLADDHFLFLGARDYALRTRQVEGGGDGDGETVDVLCIVPDSGLGILSSNTSLGRPRLLSEMAAEAQARIRELRLLNLTKTSRKATVHRAAYMDYVGVKTFDEKGQVNGERRFLGLFTSEVYNRSVIDIPRARRIVKEILNRADFPHGGHDEKRLQTVLELYPRDDLLQSSADELFGTALAIAGLQERRRVRVFSRPELFGRFVTVLVFLPRDRYNTDTRNAIESVLSEQFDGTIANWDAQMSESILARLRFVLRLNHGGLGRSVDVDDDDLESTIETLIHVWDDGFTEAVDQHFEEATALRLKSAFADAFSPGYQRAFSPRVAASDLEQIGELTEPGDLRIKAYREPGRRPNEFKVKLYRLGERLSLTAVMPILSNLGVTVVDERPFEVRASGHDPMWIYDFVLEHEETGLDFARTSALVEDAFAAAWAGRVEDDSFNRLVLRAGLTASQVAVLRAYSKYLQQIRIPYSPSFVANTVVEHPGVLRLLSKLFETRFDPDRGDEGAAAIAGLEAEIDAAIDGIDSLDHDRVLRRFRNAITSTLRTTWAQRTDGGEAKPYLAFKLDCGCLDELPEPRPTYEIFTYSPWFEGVHLRAGPVARGGLRWSDRTQDYRTEVLGLVKAQMVKNAVIVPVGAKGGFVLKRQPDDPAELRGEVVEVYQLFVSSLLDLSDNLVDGRVVPPADTRRWDGDDPYFVVAADKGTATFSDIANGLATERGFWLGDAFASGGSQGYDHKAMGITARGAWESVKRHFRELGIDVQSEPFTAVGVGDMSGDVFGNGMLLSPHTRLVAAFDHRHIFIDPDPDPATSYEERRRLFNLERSSWADYNPDLISDGGGVHKRTAKSITLSSEAWAALGLEPDDDPTLTPEQLMTAVLRAPVDLLWNGGVGTYVKASDESHADVGDKANDRIRVDGRNLRCRVVGEGGNLGVTQRGRVEFADNGGRIYTDAIDNAGGVDSSDHEVNIKILLDEIVADGDMTTKQRNELLADMTGEVAELVLANNYRQALALAMAKIDAPSLVDVHARYLDELEQRGVLDRRLEFLPDAETLSERKLAGDGLTTPELAVLSAYIKNLLSQELVDSDVIDNPAMDRLLIDYFPRPVIDRFEDRIPRHRLRREIVANRLANAVVDRAGVSLLYRLGQETSAPATEIAAAHFAAWEIYDLESLVTEVNRQDGLLPIELQMSIHLDCRQVAERVTRLLLLNRPNPFSTSDAIADLGDPVQDAMGQLGDYLVGGDRQDNDTTVEKLTSADASPELARRAAGLPVGSVAIDIVTVAGQTGLPVPIIAATYFTAGEDLGLNWLRDRILDLPRDTRWSSQARLTLRIDLYADHRQITAQVIETAQLNGDIDDREPAALAGDIVRRWADRHRREVDAHRQTMVAIRATAAPDLTTLLVAAREVRNLITRTR